MKRTHCKRALLVASFALVLVPLSLLAQEAMKSMDMLSMPHPQNNAKPSAKNTKKPAMKTGSAMQSPPQATGGLQQLDTGAQIGVRPVVRGLDLKPMHMDMPGMKMQGGNAPPGARSPDDSDGVGYGSMRGMDMADNDAHGKLLLDRLEFFDARDGNGVALDAQDWYGTDLNKLWLKAEGMQSAGRLQDLRSEALWDRSIATYWDTQLGVRHDFGVGPGRSWAAFGVQGLAPYWFNVEATAYVGQSGRTAFRFEAEYEERLTQRLILQPRFETNLYGREDRERRIGAGLSDAELGVRLRYEFTRQFAPYVGAELTRDFGKTAEFARNAGESVFNPRLVAGVHVWF